MDDILSSSCFGRGDRGRNVVQHGTSGTPYTWCVLPGFLVRSARAAASSWSSDGGAIEAKKRIMLTDHGRSTTVFWSVFQFRARERHSRSGPGEMTERTGRTLSAVQGRATRGKREKGTREGCCADDRCTHSLFA